MRNDYRIENELVFIEVIQKGVTKEVIISFEDLKRVIELDRKISISPQGYAVFNKSNKQFTLHRFLMNDPKDKQVDHIDCNRLNNSKSNLRLVTNKENANNLNNKYSVGRSGAKGVIFREGRNKPYQVRVHKKSFGYYKTIEEAKEVAANLYKTIESKSVK